MDKPFKTIDEQYELLVERGLTFNNEQKAKDYLLAYNYYNVVNCYGHFLIDHDNQYIAGSDFMEIIAIHQFDSQFKNTMFKSILDVENMFKSIVSYEFSKAYQSEQPYMNQSNFNTAYSIKIVAFQADIAKILSKYSDLKSDNSIKHYLNKHHHVPMWVLCNYMTFGQMLTMYGLLTDTLRNQISKDINKIVNQNIQSTLEDIRLSPKNIDQILGNLKDIRNLLAHDNMLFGYTCKTSFPYISSIFSSQNIVKEAQRQNVYDVFLMLRLFMPESKYAILFNSIRRASIKLHSKLSTIDSSDVMKSLGFPSDFYKVKKMDQPE